MNILELLVKLRDNLMTWVTNNLLALEDKIEETASSVSDYDNLKNKPITQDDSGELNIVDESGNVIARVDADGFHTTDVEIKEGRLSDHLKNKDIHLTSSDKSRWDNKSEFSGKYSDLEDNPIVEDESGQLVYADESGNIIAKISANGFETTKVTTKDLILDGEDIKDKFNNIHSHANKEILDGITSDKVSSWDNKSEFSGDFNDLSNRPNITEDESGEYIIADESGNIAMKVGANGLETTTVTAKKVVVNGKDVESHIVDDDIHITSEERYKWGTHVEDDDIHITASDREVLDHAITDIEEVLVHIVDDNIHITSEERDKWNNTQGFSGDYNDLQNKPNITEDESGEYVIADESGNIIMRVDAQGTHSTDFSTNEFSMTELANTYLLDVDQTNLDIDTEEIFDGTPGDVPSGSVGGGVSSWNDLTDKPFYEETVTLTFDGDTNGKEVYTLMTGIYYVKISEDAIDPNSVTPKELVIASTEGDQPYSVDMLDLMITKYSDGVHLIIHNDMSDIPLVISVTADEAVVEGITAGRGIYFLYTDDGSTSTYINKASYYYIKRLETKYVDMPFYDRSYYRELMSERVCNFVQDDSGLYAWNNILFHEDGSYELTTNFNFIEGRIYRVIFDGTEYICDSFSATLETQSGTGVGNMAITGGDDTGEPFLLGTDGNSQLVCFTTSSESSHTISIDVLVEVIKPLDEKFLPKDAIEAMIESYIDEALGGEY